MKELLVKRVADLLPDERQRLLSRAAVDFDKMEQDVRGILSDVRRRGDACLFELTQKHDKAKLASLRVTTEEMKEAYRNLPTGIVETIRHIVRNLKTFYSREVPEAWEVPIEPGITSGMLYRPFERVGVYVPGRKAIFPTIVLRICVPALVAGVKELVLASPPNSDGTLSPGVLVAAQELGLREVYKIGGAQAVGAMAYGTETIRPVQKIAAVGSPYVTAAQKFLFGVVNIDKLAGPSDGLVMVDHTAQPEVVAANMLTETEHGPTSGTVVLVPSEAFAAKVRKAVEIAVHSAPAKQAEFFETALYQYSGILVYQNDEEAVDFINDYAPEHLQLTLADDQPIITQLQNVGAIQSGAYAMIASGDFFGGTANALPTGGMAKIFSDVSVLDFMKRIPLQRFTREGFMAVAEEAEQLARYQGMYYHAESIRIRKNS